MRTNIPYNVITISEMNKNKNNIKKENINIDDLVFDKETVKKLRASSSMFNKSTYVTIERDFLHYNVESIHKTKQTYTLMLISHDCRIELTGMENEHPVIKNIIKT